MDDPCVTEFYAEFYYQTVKAANIEKKKKVLQLCYATLCTGIHSNCIYAQIFTLILNVPF